MTSRVTGRDARPRGRMVPHYVPTLPGIVKPIDPAVNELPPDNRTTRKDRES
jgi:hypothetical protein